MGFDDSVVRFELGKGHGDGAIEREEGKMARMMW